MKNFNGENLHISFIYRTFETNMLIDKIKNVKYCLTSIFILFICVSLHAEESVIFYEDAVIEGIEYLFEESAWPDNTTPQEPSMQAEIASGESSYIFIAEDAVIYGKEHLYVKQNASQNPQKNQTGAENEAPVRIENELTEDEPTDVAVSDLPFAPSSSSNLYAGRESAVTVSPQRIGKHQAACKTKEKIIYPGIEHSHLSLCFPEQRQKFSPSATQCGILTSFGPNSPSFA